MATKAKRFVLVCTGNCFNREFTTRKEAERFATDRSCGHAASVVDMRPPVERGPVSYWHADLPEVGAGKRAYEQDLRLHPKYHDGSPRKTWEQLGAAERWSWERNPTPRPPSIDREEIPTYAMRAWLVSEGLLNVASPVWGRQEIRRLIREYYDGGVDAFLRSHASNRQEI